jgi:hypothetical protein
MEGCRSTGIRAAVQEMTRLQQSCLEANVTLREHMRHAHPHNENEGSSLDAEQVRPDCDVLFAEARRISPQESRPLCS